MVEILIGQIGIGSGRCDRLGAARITGRLGFDAVQIQSKRPGKALFRGDFLFLRQQGQDRIHVLLAALHRFGLGDGLSLASDDDLAEHIGAFVPKAVPVKLLHGQRGRISAGGEIVHLADLLVVLVNDNIDREHGLRVCYIHTGRIGRQHQYGQKQQRCGDGQKF